MKIAFRKKTRSNEEIDPAHFHAGRVVWVEAEDGREQRICIGPHQEPVTLDEHRIRKARQAEHNRRVNADRVPVRRRHIRLPSDKDGAQASAASTVG